MLGGGGKKNLGDRRNMILIREEIKNLGEGGQGKLRILEEANKE